MMPDLNQDTFKGTFASPGSVTAEVGDTKQPDFYPQVKIMRWDNEVNFSARLVHDETAPVVSQVDDKIRWVGKKVTADFYELGGGQEGGGFEFDVHLLEIPASNILPFTIRTKGLDFLYQAALTPEEIALGCERPENIVGSYAVYHKTRSGDYTAFAPLYKPEMGIQYPCIHNYGSGKAGHIPRPQLVDANGRTCWGELNIDEKSGLLTVTAPWDFLRSAAYPISHAAGLTFGYDHIGASTVNTCPYNFKLLTPARAGDSAPGTPAFNGVLYSIKAYLQANTGTDYFCPALYTNADPAIRLAYLNSGGTLVPATAVWVETLAAGTLAYNNIIAGTTYKLGISDPAGVSANRMLVYYDSGSSGYGFYTPTSNWAASESMVTWIGRLSIYAVYNLAGGLLLNPGTEGGFGKFAMTGGFQT